MRVRNVDTQKYLASFLDTSLEAYGQYEREYELLPVKYLIFLCDYFDVSIDYVFGFTAVKKYKNIWKGNDKVASGERLKLLRKSHKYTQEKFAKLWNLRDTTISAYEKEKYYFNTIFVLCVCEIWGKCGLSFG